MSLRLASSQSSHIVSLWGGLGIPGSEVPTTGDNGGSPLANDGITSTSEYRIETVTAPSAGTLTVYPDTSYEFTGPDGTYTWTYRVYEDSVDRGTANETLVIGSPVAAFASTASLPAFSGSASVSGSSPETAISSTTALPTFSGSAHTYPEATTSATTAYPVFVGSAQVSGSSPQVNVNALTALPTFNGSCASTQPAQVATNNTTRLPTFSGSAYGLISFEINRVMFSSSLHFNAHLVSPIQQKVNISSTLM